MRAGLMDLRNEFTGRAVAIYVIALVITVILTPIAWGLTGGILGGLAMSRNVEYQERIETFLKEKGLDPQDNSALQKLSKTDRNFIASLINPTLADINWFLVILIVSLLTFGLVGFLGGVFARKWALAAAVPLLSFLGPNPLKSPKAELFSTLEQSIIVCAQFAVCLGLAYCGARLAIKRQERNPF
jgi:hypothetical protein